MKNLELSTIYTCDNLALLKTLPSDSVQLVLTDPPFETKSVQKSKAFDEKVQGLQYYDSMGGGIWSYTSFLKDRIEQVHRILKPSGVFCLHLDYRSVHYAKIVCDEVFGQGSHDKGQKHLINEIVWTYNRWTTKSKSFQKIHDTILVYSKDPKKYCFNIPFRNHKNSSLKEYKFLEKKNKEVVKLSKCQLNGCKKIPKGERFRTLRRKDTKGTPKDRQYLKDFPKVREGSILNIPFESKKHRLGYPTQKPLELYEIFINTFSNKNDVVMDIFAGCGTTLEAAQNLDRKWIGVDASAEAGKVIRKRLKQKEIYFRNGSLKETSLKELTNLDPKEFERACVTLLGGVYTSYTNDGGIDGRMAVDGTPIQVKQSKNIGRPVIDSFYKHLKKHGRGIIVALSFNKGAKEEARRLQVQEGIDLKLKTPKDLIKEQYLKAS